MQKGYSITDSKIIIDFSSLYCKDAQALLRSVVFSEILNRYLKRLSERKSPIYRELQRRLDDKELLPPMHTLLRLLHTHRADEVIRINRRFESLLTDPEIVYDFVEGLYNYWRSFERYIILTAPKTRLRTRESIHHAQFIHANETLRQLVLQTYRVVCENLIDTPFRIYRQLPAGAHVGYMVQNMKLILPDEFQPLRRIPVIRLALLEPPVIFYPQMNVRSGLFEEIWQNPLPHLDLKEDQWFCYPAKIGRLLALAYFHQSYMSQGAGLVNLFEIAAPDDLSRRKPDIVLFFGANPLPGIEDQTVFYHDRANEMMVGVNVHSQRIDYFGYMKKMLLTLHNILMIERDLLPVHGAMVSIRLKSGAAANVVIVGDSGAGKSETLEAFRQLAEDHISEMEIIFDDMGSIELTDEGDFLAYGTEIGAFLRLDDLQPGYAFEQMDRSIFMNPNLTNARVIVPVTTFKTVVRGTSIDYFLYANNYEAVDAGHPAIDFHDNSAQALSVFNRGLRMAKGTTSEKGLVESYFANPFGPPQRREMHETLAERILAGMFARKVAVGQLRTQLGIAGMEQEGPRIAARALFSAMSEQAV